VRILELDVRKPETIEAAVERVVRESDGIYGLVNNAGVSLQGYFEDLSGDEIFELLDTNVLGTMRVTRRVLPHMRKAGKGRIVFVTSVAARIGAPALSSYCSSKFALEGFGESLAQEMMPLGIRVVLVEPGMTKTEMWGKNSHVASMAMDPCSPYRSWFESQQELAGRLLDSSRITANGVAKTILKVLMIGRPKLRYIVGSRAKLVVWLRRYIPGELFERVYFGEAVRRITGSKD
jgi:short-subunit dehydrogenase